jgi:hypothetical protein
MPYPHLFPAQTNKPTVLPTVSQNGAELAAQILSAKDVFEVDAVNAAEMDGYTVTSAVCEVISPMHYLPSSSIFGGQLVFHAFRLSGPGLGSEVVVLFASNHTAANGSGLVIPINPEAISLNQGFSAGTKAVEPITIDTPGAQTALTCARQAGEPPKLELGNLDVEAWRLEAIKKFGPEQTNSDGSKDDYVRSALSLCRYKVDNPSVKYDKGTFQQFVIETFCPYAEGT